MKSELSTRMKTALAQLIERLEEAYDLNPMEPDYREGLAEAIGWARNLLPVERADIKHAWRDGASGILNQTAEQYLRETYENS